MVVLYTESQREAAAKRAASKRSGKTAGSGAGAGAGGKGGSSRKLAGFGSGDVDDGALTPSIGAVSSETNPMFLRSAESGGGSSATAAFDSIMAQREAPSQSLWMVFQNSYAELRTSAAQLAEQLATARADKAKLEARVASGELGGAGSDVAAPPPAITRRNKTAFAPTASAADDDGGEPAGAASPLGARGRSGSNAAMRRTPSGLGAAAAAAASGARTVNPLRATRVGGGGGSGRGATRGRAISGGGDDE